MVELCAEISGLRGPTVPVGGGSRIPLVASLLQQAFGKAPTVVEQPELVVAQGAVGASVQFTLPFDEAWAREGAKPPEAEAESGEGEARAA